MVHQPSERGSLNIAVVVLAFVAGFASCVFVTSKYKSQTIYPNSLMAVEPEQSAQSTSEDSPQIPKLIDLQPIVDEWAATLGPTSKIGVEIFDLDNNQLVAEKNQDQIFPTESLYKLFVVYEGYRQIEQGNANLNDIITHNYTYQECLDLAIRESNSVCAEAIRATIGIQTLEKVIKNEFNLKNSSNIGLTSTASDITEMMKIYYSHPDLSEETWQKIQDSMLNQPPVDNGFCSGPCDWRRGLPSGFSTAEIYNKVGWRYGTNSWESYNDTAFAVFPAQNRHYIITIMTQNTDYKQIAKLGTMIEKAIIEEN